MSHDGPDARRVGFLTFVSRTVFGPPEGSTRAEIEGDLPAGPGRHRSRIDRSRFTDREPSARPRFAARCRAPARGIATAPVGVPPKKGRPDRQPARPLRRVALDLIRGCRSGARRPRPGTGGGRGWARAPGPNPASRPGPPRVTRSTGRPGPDQSPLGQDQAAVQGDIRQGQAVARPDRALMASSCSKPEPRNDAASAGRRPIAEHQGLVDRQGRHLGEGQVPPPAPEFAQAGRPQRRAEQGRAVHPGPPPGAGQDVEDAEVDDQAQPRQQQRRREPPGTGPPPRQPGQGDQGEADRTPRDRRLKPSSIDPPS